MTQNNLEHILLIDDDFVFTQVLSRSLTKRGYSVGSAQSSLDAFDQIHNLEPKKIVLDLRLAQENGLELIPKLRSRLPDCAILILTGYSSIQTAVRAVQLGAVNYLCKPADTNEILAAFNASAEVIPQPASKPPSVDRLEWEHIQKVLAQNNGNVSATARDLGMHRRTLQRKLQKRPVKK